MWQHPHHFHHGYVIKSVVTRSSYNSLITYSEVKSISFNALLIWCMNCVWIDYTVTILKTYLLYIIYQYCVWRIKALILVVDKSKSKIENQIKFWKGIQVTPMKISRAIKQHLFIPFDNILCKCKLLIGSQTKYQLCAAFDFFLTSYMTHTLTAVIPKLLARPHIKWNSSWCKFL